MLENRLFWIGKLAVVRTYNRKFLDIIGMTPGEFRQLLESGRRSEH